MEKKKASDLAWRVLYTIYAILIIGGILLGLGLLIHNLIFGMSR
jgi:hypothetical protein